LFTELGRAGRLKRPFAIFQAGLRAFVKQHSGAAEKITIIATGGTAATMAMLDLGLAHYDEDRVHGHELTAEAIGAIAAELRATPVAARQFLPGLEEGRGDIILAGIEIYQEILATIEVDGMMISDSGLLEGIILSCLERGSL
jgi:exopolyphosphatase/guanosine-5'-triphosphate,3'-diphosphate pyrophosphatase